VTEDAIAMPLRRLEAWKKITHSKRLMSIHPHLNLHVRDPMYDLIPAPPMSETDVKVIDDVVERMEVPTTIIVDRKHLRAMKLAKIAKMLRHRRQNVIPLPAEVVATKDTSKKSNRAGSRITTTKNCLHRKGDSSSNNSRKNHKMMIIIDVTRISSDVAIIVKGFQERKTRIINISHEIVTHSSSSSSNVSSQIFQSKNAWMFRVELLVRRQPLPIT